MLVTKSKITFVVLTVLLVGGFPNFMINESFADVDTSPTLISATADVAGEIDLVWNQIALSNSETFTNYKLYRHTSASFTPPGTGTEVTECSAMTTITTTTCTDAPADLVKNWMRSKSTIEF